MKKPFGKKKQKGFTLIEIVVACVLFPMIVVGLNDAYGSVRKTYTLSKQFNEMYAVLSACPEIDRALEYDVVSGTNNCYPNNSFYAEGASGNIITYTPTLSVTSTSNLPANDPLQTIPDSKVIDISVGYFHNPTAAPLELRMLITRNGIGQL